MVAAIGCGEKDTEQEDDGVETGDAEVRGSVVRDAGGDARSGSPGDAGRPLDAARGEDARTQPEQDGASELGDGSSAEPGAEELALALDPSGVRADARRIDVVLQAWCKHEVGCELIDDQQTCVDETYQSWLFLIASENQPCIDATLDNMACYAKAKCDEVETCLEGLRIPMELCADLFMQGAEP